MTQKRGDADSSIGRGGLAWGRELTAQTFGAFAGLAPVRESAMAQLGRGRFSLKGRMVYVDDIVIAELNVGVRYSAQVLPNPDYVALMLPLSWDGAYIFNGVPATPNTMFISSSPDGYLAQSNASHSLTVGLRRSVLASAVSLWVGTPAADIRIVDGAYRLTPGRTVALCSAIRSTQGLVLASDLTALDDTFWHDRHDMLATEIAAAYVAAMSGYDGLQAPYPTSVEIAKRAIATFRESGDGTPSIGDLSAACGVGLTNMNAAFNEVLGAAPGRYFRMRRLMRARELLLDGETRRLQVKNIALRLGFKDLGRFAHSYAQLFGELPSETLRRRS